MNTRTLKVTLIVLALLAGAAFAVGHEDHPCTGDDCECTECTCEPGEECTCESGCECTTDGCDCETECEDCTCDSHSTTEETSARVEDLEETGCQGCHGHGCH
jgi:hypothetical protein